MTHEDDATLKDLEDRIGGLVNQHFHSWCDHFSEVMKSEDDTPADDRILHGLVNMHEQMAATHVFLSGVARRMLNERLGLSLSDEDESREP